MWMGNNKLNINPDKMEITVNGDRQIRGYLKTSFPVSFLGNIMEPAESVKKLSVILDAENSMQRHVANLCYICYYHFRELQRVCSYLNHETAVKEANALVSSSLDYCNLLLYHKKMHIFKHYKEFKMPVCKLNKFIHLTPFLYKLHWFPIHYHILFKDNLLI